MPHYIDLLRFVLGEVDVDSSLLASLDWGTDDILMVAGRVESAELRHPTGLSQNSEPTTIRAQRHCEVLSYVRSTAASSALPPKHPDNGRVAAHQACPPQG
jgi:hypothetical protein